MPMIYVCPLEDVDANVADLAPSHLVSLLDPAHMIETPRGLMPDQHLKVGINDIAVPQAGLIAPEDRHIAELIEFLGGWPGEAPLLIHCWAGISRSTAAAFIALCQRNDGYELDLAYELRDRAPYANPNKRIIHIADRLMGRQGRMVAAVAAMGPPEFAPLGRTFSIDHRLDARDAK